MPNTNVKVDNYLSVGCGRCAKGGTPECKVNQWHDELKQLRELVLSSGLTEELKWGVPCYTYEKSNIVLIHAFKEYCALLFHKGALLKDTHNLLIQQTENVQGSRQVRFTNVADIIALEPVLLAYLHEAIAVEQSGAKVVFKKTEEFSIPDELQQKFNAMPAFKVAFQSLTPGRQRGYLLIFFRSKTIENAHGKN